MVASAILIGLASILSISGLQSRASRSRSAEASVGLLDGLITQRLTTPLETEMGTSDRVVAHQIDGLDKSIDATVDRLRDHDPVSAIPAVARALAASRRAEQATAQVLTQLGTIRGRAAVGEAIQHRNSTSFVKLTAVQRSYPALSRALAQARSEYAARARRAQGQAIAGSAIIIGLLLIVFLMAYLCSITARADAERLAAENADLASRNERHALTDALTQLGNRRSLLSELEEALASDQPTVLALCDLNGFKEHNDTYGHLAGDELLVRFSAQLSASLPETARAFRMGGDEFCVLVEADELEARAIVAVAADAFMECDGASRVSASWGIAVAGPRDTPTELLRRADRRMYRHKAEQRGQHVASQTRSAVGSDPPSSGGRAHPLVPEPILQKGVGAA